MKLTNRASFVFEPTGETMTVVVDPSVRSEYDGESFVLVRYAGESDGWMAVIEDLTFLANDNAHVHTCGRPALCNGTCW